MEFYQQNPDYKKLGTYISKISNSDSTIGVSVLNYLMLRDTIFADQVMYLTNKCILLASLKQRLEKAVIKHKEYIRDKNLLTNVQQQEQIEELKTTLLEQQGLVSKLTSFLEKTPGFNEYMHSSEASAVDNLGYNEGVGLIGEEFKSVS
jgi:hypothetical protein